MPPEPSRQTLSYLRNLFERQGIRPRKSLGQNFLIDLNLHDLIVRTAQVGEQDVILEVGPGTGALTTRMAGLASAVVAVEFDPALAELTRQAVAASPNVRVLQADALAGKNRINPLVLDHLRSALAVAPDRRLKLVANLPYHVATPLITNLLYDPLLRVELMVVTIQLELAERLIAQPGTSAYSGLSVLVQALAQVELVRTLAPSVFWPRPQVQSAIVRIAPEAALRARLADPPWFQTVVRRVFLHRRKNLRGAILAEWEGQGLDKPTVDHLLEDLGLSATGPVRAEALDVEEFASLAAALRDRLPAPPARPDDGPEREDPLLPAD